jgi:hypothetical protein
VTARSGLLVAVWVAVLTVAVTAGIGQVDAARRAKLGAGAAVTVGDASRLPFPAPRRARAVPVGAGRASRPVNWRTGLVTSLATWEPGLDGCRYQGEQKVCSTSCDRPGVPWAWRHLNDRALVAIANPVYGLACGARVVFLRWNGHRMVRQAATIVGVTGALRYDFEFSWRLSRVFGAPNEYGRPLTWSATVSWRVAR